MKHYGVQTTLIDRTINVVAKEGLDKTTTKAIVGDTGINEAYIYKFFKDKDDLLATTFSALDDELCSKAMSNISVMYMPNMDFELRCQFFFSYMWQFLLRNQDKCLAFIRYYHSPYFKKYSSEEHKKRYLPLVDKFSDAFQRGSNTWIILHHILETMLGFAEKVFSGELKDDENTAKHVFAVVYSAVSLYKKEPANITS